MKIHCNYCGKTLQEKNGVLLEDALIVEKSWGYFSQKDREHHRFCLCEACYDEIRRQFQIPVSISEKTELL